MLYKDHYISCTLRPSTAVDRDRTSANAEDVLKNLASKACYCRRRRAHARFLRPSSAFAHVRSRSTAVDVRNARVTYVSCTLRPQWKRYLIVLGYCSMSQLSFPASIGERWCGIRIPELKQLIFGFFLALLRVFSFRTFDGLFFRRHGVVVASLV